MLELLRMKSSLSAIFARVSHHLLDYAIQTNVSREGA
jgi:hypothetical protein